MKKKELLKRIEELEQRVNSLEAGRYIYMTTPTEISHDIVWTCSDELTNSWDYNNASNTN